MNRENGKTEVIMDIDTKQAKVIADMLGTPKVVWSKPGAVFFSQKNEEMDKLVTAGALQVEETAEVWGPTVTYVVTEGRMSAAMLGGSIAGNHGYSQQLREELDITDKLLAERERVLRSIPECPAHGPGCVPHALDWIEQAKTALTDVGVDNFEFKISCEKPHENLDYWTARLIGADPHELNLAVTGPSKDAAILAVLDMYVCGRTR